MSSATKKRLAPKRGTRRGPTVGHRRLNRRIGADLRILSFRSETSVVTLEDAVLLTIAAIDSGNPAACLVCEAGLMTADGCESCGSRLE